ncbi:MAG: hypothetical protein EKK52_00145 [Burkholderiales bacterium]|uniref:helix-turn-helix domain-containing protein n=1 Tax=Roseateles sp. TaxID=1971397 RepID=UPI000FA6FD35|nr:MAG: hypothetical protein EKK52_00145 [Burkholderiales bacterium]
MQSSVCGESLVRCACKTLQAGRAQTRVAAQRAVPPAALIEAEGFGYRPGAVTGAKGDHKLPDDVAGGGLRELAGARIRETLAAVEGNVSEAARRLRVIRNTLYRRLSRTKKRAGL